MSPNRLRVQLNRSLSRHRLRRERRRFRPDRTLVLADHWSGSVQQFYHFLLGYLGPFAAYAQAHPGEALALRDCGPMNAWIDAIRPDVDVTTVSVGYALNTMIRAADSARILVGLDDPARFRRRDLVGAAAAMRWLMGAEDVPPTPGLPQVVVIDRQVTDPFYRSSQSETEMGGQERRSTPGLPAAVADLPLAVPSRVVELTGMAPAEQIRLFSRATVIVGQHGAGLAHMLWLPAGSTVVEIQPPLVPGVDHIFRELALALGHRYAVVPQASVHAPVEPAALASALRSVGVLSST